MYLSVILALYFALVVQCSSTTSSTTITCPGSQEICGGKYCYDPATQYCTETGSIVTCIDVCGRQCYNSLIEVCINGALCPIGQDLCEVKYDSYGNLLVPPQLQCYYSSSYKCLNHTLCSYDRECDGQCITGYDSNYKLCVNNTICPVQSPYYTYQPNQIQFCNGSCYDTGYPPLKHCVNGTVQCIWNCSNRCYNATMQVCLNGTLCSIGQDICETDYDPYSGWPIKPSRVECYSPQSSKCIERALCSTTRICNGQCITGYNSDYQVCANDKHTICNVTDRYSSSCRQYPVHLCNGKCYDTTIRQCVDGLVTCIDDECGSQCYNSANQVCINGSLCSIGQDLCEIKYNSYGDPVVPSQLRCYNLKSEKCLNHTICSYDRECNGQCITGYNLNYKLCINNTICPVENPYYTYQPNQIQFCNGSCYDSGYPPLKRCINGIVQCISNCSNKCYDTTSQICINGTLCSIGRHVCELASQRYCYNPTSHICINGTLCSIGQHVCGIGSCYNPATHICLNNTLCSNNRTCGKKCIANNYQICANDKITICNVTKEYNYYGTNQIQLCLGVCYDSFIQQCSGDHIVLCIHDPVTQQCVPQNINSSTTTTLSPSISTINSISFYAGTNTSDFSTSTSATNSFIATNNAEASPNSISLFTTTSTASPSISLSRTSPLTDLTDFSTESSSYETKTSTTTIFPASEGNFTLYLSSSSSSEGINIPSISPHTTPFPMFSSSSPTSATTETGPDASIISTEKSSNPLSDSPNSSTFMTETPSQTTITLTSTFPLSSSSSSEGTNIPSIYSDTTSSTMLATPGTDPDTSITSTETVSNTLSHLSNIFTFKTESPSQTTLSLASALLISSSFSSEGTKTPSISADSSSSRTLATTGTDPSASIILTERSSNPLSNSSNSLTFTTESPSQTTVSFTATLPSQGSCCGAKECANDSDCCAPRIECRCYRHNRTRGYSRECKAIVIGENNNNSFVVAIAINDEKVIVMNKNHFVLLLLSMPITYLVLLLIRISVVIVIYRKKTAMNFRLLNLVVKRYITESQKKPWERP